MIQPVIIVVGKAYRAMARVCLGTYSMHHAVHHLLVLTEARHMKEVRAIAGSSVDVCAIEEYEGKARRTIGIEKYSTVRYEDIKHMRVYSSLKPLIAEYAIQDYAPMSTYAMTMDIDGIYTGNVMELFESALTACSHQFDLYMVERSDLRMHRLKSKHTGIGSGVTLWRRKSPFMHLFIKHYIARYAGDKGGSQELINKIRVGHNQVKGHLFKNPYLHMVSPDLVADLSDEQIRQMTPAYIHLHGTKCVERQQRFAKAFGYDF